MKGFRVLFAYAQKVIVNEKTAIKTNSINNILAAKIVACFINPSTHISKLSINRRAEFVI
jgi:hypothetical protein